VIRQRAGRDETSIALLALTATVLHLAAGVALVTAARRAPLAGTTTRTGADPAG
jgi:hypothetical protein